MSLTPSDLSPSVLWYTAYASPPGIKIRVFDPIRAKTLLYTARAKLRDPDLNHLRLLTSPTDPKGELWIVNDGSGMNHAPTNGAAEPERILPPGAILDLGEI